MSIDFKTFNSVVPHVLAVKKPVLLRGRHGIGKSQVVYQVAETMGLPVVERRASQMTEGDLVGLPSINGDRTSFNPPDWFKTACEEAVVLFLDEVDRATVEVRQGIFELTDSRKLNGHNLHPETLIVAAVNGGEHGAQYQVGEMDPAELDRWTVFDVEPTVEDWLDWAKNNVNSLVWDFINANRRHLEHDGEFEPNKKYPSRRSWDRLNECLEMASFLQEPKKSLSPIFNIACGFVGFEAAVAFRDYAQNYDSVITPMDLMNPETHEETLKKIKEFDDINAHMALSEKFSSEEIFEQELTDEQIKNFAEYFVIAPSEVAMVLWSVIGNSSRINEYMPKFHGSRLSDGNTVAHHTVKMFADKDESEK